MGIQGKHSFIKLTVVSGSRFPKELRARGSGGVSFCLGKARAGPRGGGWGLCVRPRGGAWREPHSRIEAYSAGFAGHVPRGRVCGVCAWGIAGKEVRAVTASPPPSGNCFPTYYASILKTNMNIHLYYYSGEFHGKTTLTGDGTCGTSRWLAGHGFQDGSWMALSVGGGIACYMEKKSERGMRAASRDVPCGTWALSSVRWGSLTWTASGYGWRVQWCSCVAGLVGGPREAWAEASTLTTWQGAGMIQEDCPKLSERNCRAEWY